MLEVESKKEFITYISNNPKIFKPKPKKLCSSYIPNTYMQKKSLHKNKTLTPILNANFYFGFNDENIKSLKSKKEIKHLNNNPKLQIEKISFKEMEEDFLKLNERKEIKKAEKELLYLIRNSTKDDSQDDNSKEKIKVKRPKNPFLQNFE